MKIALIAGVLFLVGAAIAGVYFLGQTFMYTEGISETQIDSYSDTVDSANELQEKVNNSNKNALDKLKQID